MTSESELRKFLVAIAQVAATIALAVGLLVAILAWQQGSATSKAQTLCASLKPGVSMQAADTLVRQAVPDQDFTSAAGRRTVVFRSMAGKGLCTFTFKANRVANSRASFLD
jgi:hypothetical protein